MAGVSLFVFPLFGGALLLAACDSDPEDSNNQSPLMSAAAAASKQKAATPLKLTDAAAGSLRAAGEVEKSTAALSCTPIQFERGTISATVRGSVPSQEPRASAPRPACYSLAVGEGQAAKVRLLAGENVGITIPGVGDMRDSLEFRTRRGTYRIELYQLSPAAEPSPFRLYVEVAADAAGPSHAGNEAPIDFEKLVLDATALKYLCENGSTNFCVDAGAAYMNGDGVAVDLARARALFERGCVSGHDVFGCYAVGAMRLNGQGAPVDKRGARTAFQLACDGGDGDGCYAVGVMKYNGQGGLADKRGARTALEKACELGHERACLAAHDLGDPDSSSK